MEGADPGSALPAGGLVRRRLFPAERGGAWQGLANTLGAGPAGSGLRGLRPEVRSKSAFRLLLAEHVGSGLEARGGGSMERLYEPSCAAGATPRPTLPPRF